MDEKNEKAIWIRETEEVFLLGVPIEPVDLITLAESHGFKVSGQTKGILTSYVKSINCRGEIATAGNMEQRHKLDRFYGCIILAKDIYINLLLRKLTNIAVQQKSD